MKDIKLILFAAYLVAMSIIGFLAMGIDKRRAIKREWRISERTLLLIAIIGGGIGSFLGMQTFHHKTQKLKFKLLLPLSAIVYLILCVSLFS